MTDQKAQTIRRTFSGEVVSDKGDKTIVVKIDRVVTHPKYHKRYMVSKRYAVHDPENQYHVGEQVEFVECRPISKQKRWVVRRKSTKA